MTNILNKAIFIVLCASVLCALLIANDFEAQKSANAAKLITAIAEARQAERSAAASRSLQNEILEQKIKYLTPHIPHTAFEDYKAKAVMKPVGKVRS